MESSKSDKQPGLELQVKEIADHLSQLGYDAKYCIQGLNCRNSFFQTITDHLQRNPQNAFPVCLSGSVGDLPGSTALFARFEVSKIKNELRVTELNLCYRDQNDRLLKHDLPIHKPEDIPTVQHAETLMLRLNEKIVNEKNSKKGLRP